MENELIKLLAALGVGMGTATAFIKALNEYNKRKGKNADAEKILYADLQKMYKENAELMDNMRVLLVKYNNLKDANCE